MKTKVLAILPFFLFISCNPNYDMQGMFNNTSENVDTRFEESMLWNANNQYFNEYSALLVDDNYQIYVCADTHVDSTNRNLQHFCEEVKKARLTNTSTFAIYLGDLINGKNNFPLFSQTVNHDSLSTFTDSTFYVLGNHDIYFNQWKIFKSYFHTSVFWFCTKSKTTGQLLDLFICLDSAQGTLGKKQLAWLKNILEQSSKQPFRHKIIITHTNFFNSKNIAGHPSNYPMEETYLLTDLFTQYSIDMIWAGHEHNHGEKQYGGVKYIVLATMQDPSQYPEFMIADMDQKIRCSFINW